MSEHTTELKSYLRFFLFALLLLLLFRAAFWLFLAIGQDAPDPLGPEFLKAFYIGLRFDARLAALFTLPLGLLVFIPQTGRRLHCFARAVFWVYFPLFFLLAGLYALDAGFYLYLGQRLNSTVLELMQDTGASLRMVWESYPVVPLFLAGLALGLLCAMFFYRAAARPIIYPSSTRRRILNIGAAFLLFAWAVYGQLDISLFPLRWSNAYFSSNQQVTALALNPAQNLYDTGRVPNSPSYNMERLLADYTLLASYLGVKENERKNLNLARSVAAKPNPAAPRPNIVIIVMESLAYPKTSFAPGLTPGPALGQTPGLALGQTPGLAPGLTPDAGSPPDTGPTPFLRELAAESALYHRFFANTRTTARAMFTLITGIPDVSQSSTGTRNPFAADQRLLGEEFAGYKKFYMTGGSASWANLRALLSHNISALNVLEEKDWHAPKVNLWGISDLDLFRGANRALAKESEPFWAIIQTGAFHRPYTISDEKGFNKKTLDEKTKEHYGFISEQEYNSLRFSDFSLQEFFRLARKEAYYANTIFFILGDHGLSDRPGNMSNSYCAAGLESWHVPLIIHGPGVPKGEFYTPCGTTDIFPTAAGLAGIAYNNHTLGRDILAPRSAEFAATYIGGNSSVPVRLVQDGYCLFDDRGSNALLYKLDDNNGKDYAKEEAERFAGMRALGLALDNAAQYLLFNNKKQ